MQSFTNSLQHSFALALTSRQISKEFLHYAYEHANFTFLMKSLCTASWSEWDVSDAVLSRVRHIRFVRDCHDESRGSVLNSDRELHPPKLVAKCPMLKAIEVEVILKKSQLEDAKIKKIERWSLWCDTLAGKMQESNVWVLPACDWHGSWIV